MGRFQGIRFMRRKAPAVREVMTHLPVELERCETVDDAISLMEAYHIRHIPIMSGSHLKGIVSQRNILSARVRYADQLDTMAIEGICETEALTVSPLDPVNEVAAQMLSRQTDCVVVVDGGFVVGIFTSTDALRVLCQLFAGSR